MLVLLLLLLPFLPSLSLLPLLTPARLLLSQIWGELWQRWLCHLWVYLPLWLCLRAAPTRVCVAAAADPPQHMWPFTLSWVLQQRNCILNVIAIRQSELDVGVPVR